LIWSHVGKTGDGKFMNDGVLDILEAEMDIITNDIEDFFQQIKDKKGLKEKLRDNPWNSILDDVDESLTTVSNLKNKTQLVKISLEFLVTFINNCTNESLELQKRAISIMLQ